MLQRTEDWYKERAGRFTASSIHKLLTHGSRQMTEKELEEYKKENPKGRKKTIQCIGDMLYTYAFEKAIEVVYGLEEEEGFISRDMQRGIDHEPLAFRLLKEILAHRFVSLKECGFIPYGEFSGSSPDGLASDNYNVEIKCPRRTKFFKIVANGLEAIDPEYYDQMQMQMLSTGCTGTYFFNYYLSDEGEEFFHLLEVERDEERIDFLKSRILIAEEAKQSFIKTLKEKQQFING